MQNGEIENIKEEKVHLVQCHFHPGSLTQKYGTLIWRKVQDMYSLLNFEMLHSLHFRILKILKKQMAGNKSVICKQKCGSLRRQPLLLEYQKRKQSIYVKISFF